EKLIVLIHGWNSDSPPAADMYQASADWMQLVNALKRTLPGSGWSLVEYHWEEKASTGPLVSPDFIAHAVNSAKNGDQEGHVLASLISQVCPDLRRIHFIAHSAGVWVAREATV